MKTKIMMAAILTGVVIAAGAAQAQGQRDRLDFASLDLNADGSVTIQEMEAHGEARFAQADTNGDGALSQEELITAAGTRAQERAGTMIERLDANGDGLLQQAEMRPRGGDRLERIFAVMDADNNGAVTQAEFEAAKDRLQSRRGG